MLASFSQQEGENIEKNTHYARFTSARQWHVIFAYISSAIDQSCGTELTKTVVLKHSLLGFLGRGNKTVGVYNNSVFWSTSRHFCPFSNPKNTLFTPKRGRPSYHLATVSGSKSGPPGDSQSYTPSPHVALFHIDKIYASLQWTMLEYGKDIHIRYFHSKREGQGDDGRRVAVTGSWRCWSSGPRTWESSSSGRQSRLHKLVLFSGRIPFGPCSPWPHILLSVSVLHPATLHGHIVNKD